MPCKTTVVEVAAPRLEIPWFILGHVLVLCGEINLKLLVKRTDGGEVRASVGATGASRITVLSTYFYRPANVLVTDGLALRFHYFLVVC